jgi:hypothetical protein
MTSITLYSQHPQRLTLEQLKDLAGKEAQVSQESADEFAIQYAEVRIVLSHDLKGRELADHLNGFQGFVRHHAGPSIGELQDLLDDIGATEFAIGCTVEPDFDTDNVAKSFIVSLACTYERCLMFYNDAIMTPFGEVCFGPPETKAFADLSKLSVRKIAIVDFPKMSEDQQARYERVGELLKRYEVPEPDMKRCWVDDSQDVHLRTPQEVARRVLALHAVVCIARGRDREKTMTELRAAGAEDALTAVERQFLADGSVEESERQKMIWGLERLWLLMWSLRHIDKFGWPNTMCDVDGIHSLIFDRAIDPIKFIDEASLRGKKSILDAAQLVIQIHSAIRGAMTGGESIPENLNWANPTGFVPVTACAANGVVAERHFTLNWLTRFGDVEWDHVDTPTVPRGIG